MSYNKRLIHGTNTIVKRLEGIYPDQEQMDKAHNDLALALGTYQEVYMEIGMKVGVRLIYQLLVVDDELPIRNEQ